MPFPMEEKEFKNEIVCTIPINMWYLWKRKKKRKQSVIFYQSILYKKERLK